MGPWMRKLLTLALEQRVVPFEAPGAKPVEGAEKGEPDDFADAGAPVDDNGKPMNLAIIKIYPAAGYAPAVIDVLESMKASLGAVADCKGCSVAFEAGEEDVIVFTERWSSRDAHETPCVRPYSRGFRRPWSFRASSPLSNFPRRRKRRDGDHREGAGGEDGHGRPVRQLRSEFGISLQHTKESL